MEELLDQAWATYVMGGQLTREQATAVWSEFQALGDEDDRVARLITLGRFIDDEAVRGIRCSVCAGVEGNHDDC